MKLIECYVARFGKLEDKKYEFASGFNCINEENGSGKTTLAAFIKAMLYGMSDTKKVSLEENERKHYLPWRGGNASGSLTFECGGKRYRVERSFAPKAADDTFALYDLTLGKSSSDYSERLGEEIFGIDADGFERTVFLSERALSPKSDNKSISAKLSNLVGCDGDMGDMDEALKRLESERKFYYKKGGSGELSEIKAKITALGIKLDELEQTEEKLTVAQQNLLELSRQNSSARTEISSLAKEREKAAVRVAKSGYDKHLKDMQASLAESTRRKGELLEKFGGTPPSFQEIDEASLKSIEIKRLTSKETLSDEESEYIALRTVFDGKILPEDIEKTRLALAKRSERESVAMSAEAKRLRADFSKRIPEDSELMEMVALTKKKSKAIYIFPLSAIPVLIGIVLGYFVHPALYALILISAVLVAVGVGFCAKEDKENEEKIRAFLSSVSDKPLPDKDNLALALTMMHASLARARDLLGDTGDDSEEIISKVESKFPEIRGAEQIIKKYERYTSLSLGEQYKSKQRSERTERAKRLAEEIDVFLARFKVESDDPFAELRRGLTEYNMLTSEILAKRGEIENFGALHSLGEDDEGIATLSLDEIDVKIHTLEEKSAEISRQVAITERACNEYTEALEERDELIMKQVELEELLKKQEENYNTILLTKKYLTEARENLTVRYLGKTKEGFIRYAKEISGVVGEDFIMDTDFGVSIMDGGTTRSTDAYSRGTKDLYNLAARLGLVDSLYEGERPFILLDDPFCSFDDKKTEAAIKLLKSFAKERQIIYFTCSSSREG